VRGRNTQGKLIGQIESLGFELKRKAALQSLTLEVLKLTDVEAELLEPEQDVFPGADELTSSKAYYFYWTNKINGAQQSSMPRQIWISS